MSDGTREGPEASEFLREAEARLLDLAIEQSRADWVQSTYVTDDTQALASKATARLMQATAELAKEAARFRASSLRPEHRRKLHLLRVSLPLIGPADPRETEELSALVNDMQGTYAKGRVSLPGREGPLDLEALGRIQAESRDPEELLRIWTGWHTVSIPMRPKFTRYVELANRGARELGFEDTGAMWRSKYEMPSEEFSREVDRLWTQLAPLYRSLHAYVRQRLHATYGLKVVPADGLIPAHLLGNMWAQSWDNLTDLLAPPSSAPAEDLTKVLVERRTSPRQMVEYAERFFVSLGLDPLPASFWERSMFVRPQDREVVCHASAWDLDFVNDVRIKMCIDITAEEFRVIHHELGHNYYQRACGPLDFLYRDGANDGFHEAIGDTIALSVTPEYLQKIGLASSVPDPSGDVGLLLARALAGVAFLPFGLLVDQWRWGVFDGSVPPSEYNRSWWELRAKYQGIAPPGPRDESFFDPGAKYHVPANVPYMRYFLAHVLQFQFHRGLARAIGWKGPLHRCSIYGEPEAGKRFRAMLELGASRPWPDALEAICGERVMDANAVLEYFAPLQRWLDEQNRGHPVGW
jgi:peptidyl-dipeptidase A